jgi:hypothetical protein
MHNVCSSSTATKATASAHRHAGTVDATATGHA